MERAAHEETEMSQSYSSLAVIRRLLTAGNALAAELEAHEQYITADLVKDWENARRLALETERRL
jgi:hypothetical protein